MDDVGPGGRFSSHSVVLPGNLVHYLKKGTLQLFPPQFSHHTLVRTG